MSLTPLDVLVVVLIVLAADLFLAGGAMSMGMMGGVTAMMATPVGWALILVLIVVAYFVVVPH